MRLTLAGYGAVAAIHARRLRARGVEMHAVYGPSLPKAHDFAAAHGFPIAVCDFEPALEGADAVIVCSPSAAHYGQAMAAVSRSVATLVELPACGSLEECTALSAAARASGAILQCAHSSHYLFPYRLIGSWIAAGSLGGIRGIYYTRTVPSRGRSWSDDALLHHAAHPLDLFLHWFGALRPLGCAAAPAVPGPQDVAMVAALPGGSPASIAVSYTARLASVRMTVCGADHTVVTDGFSRIESDAPEFQWSGDERETYEQAIEDQDLAFLDACRTGCGGVSWEVTMRLQQYLEAFAGLWNRT